MPAPGPPETTSARSVLVADDSRFYRTLVGYALTEEGYRALSASSGEEALATLARELPDVHLLLLDLVLPGMSGFALLERLRALPGAASLPVLLVTQFGLNPLERAVLKSQGVLAVVPKSAPIERLLGEVREALHPEEHEQRQAPRAPATLAVTVRWPGATHITTSFNLSEGGLYVTLAEGEPPRPGSEVELKLWVPDEERVFQLRGRVAWVNQPGASFRRSLPPGFGVELAAGEAERAALRRFVAATALA